MNNIDWLDAARPALAKKPRKPAAGESHAIKDSLSLGASRGPTAVGTKIKKNSPSRLTARSLLEATSVMVFGPFR